MKKRHPHVKILFACAIMISLLLLLTIAYHAQAQALPPKEDQPQAACNPQVRSALLEASRTGAERATGIINNPVSGVGLPESVFTLGCLDSIFATPNINILFDPGGALKDLLRQIEERICAIGRDYYNQKVTRPFDEAVFRARIPNLPGLRVNRTIEKGPTLPNVEVVPPQKSFPSQGTLPPQGSNPDQGNWSLQDLYRDRF